MPKIVILDELVLVSSGYHLLTVIGVSINFESLPRHGDP